MYGETFNGRHTAQHQLQRRQIKIQDVRSFKSSEHIRKEVDGPYFEVSAKKASSVTLQ